MQSFFSRITRQLNDAGNLQTLLQHVLLVLLFIGIVAYITVRIDLTNWVVESDSLFVWGGIFFCINVVHLQLLRRFVDKSMHASSLTIKTSDRENDPGNPTLTTLQLEEFDCTAVSPEAEIIREELIAVNSGTVWRMLIFSLLACSVYIVLPFILGEEIPYGLALVYFVVIVLGFVFYKSKYRAKSNQPSTIYEEFLTLIKLISHPFYARTTGLLFATLMFFISLEDLESTGVFWASILHVGIIVLLWAYPLLKPYSGPNIKLLVLRVFGSERQTRFVFNSTIPFWSLFGTYMTIDGRSYAKTRYGFWGLRVMWRFLGVEAFGFSEIWYLPFCLILIFVAYDWIELYQRRPPANITQINERINRVLAHPKPFGIYFRDLRLLSFMNVWKTLIPVFVEKADVILMDLREYSEERDGVNWEGNYIFDYKPLGQIIFLRDKESDQEEIHNFIQSCWAKLEQGSPNENLPNPVARIFVMGRKQVYDVPVLIDALLAAARPDKLQPTRQ